MKSQAVAKLSRNERKKQIKNKILASGKIQSQSLKMISIRNAFFGTFIERDFIFSDDKYKSGSDQEYYQKVSTHNSKTTSKKSTKEMKKCAQSPLEQEHFTVKAL